MSKNFGSEAFQTFQAFRLWTLFTAIIFFSWISDKNQMSRKCWYIKVYDPCREVAFYRSKFFANKAAFTLVFLLFCFFAFRCLSEIVGMHTWSKLNKAKSNKNFSNKKILKIVALKISLEMSTQWKDALVRLVSRATARSPMALILFYLFSTYLLI